MIKNYIKIAFRNLIRDKGFSFINISGLAVGMAGAILILLWIQNELSYDQFHSKRDQLYLAYNRSVFEGKLHCWSSSPSPLGPALKAEYPEVVNFARYGWEDEMLLSHGNKRLNAKGTFTDSAFLTMFSLPLLKGNARTALTGSSAVVITESLAKKIFGDTDPINKIIRIDNQDNFEVTGVLKDLPPNTRFRFEYLLPWQYMVRRGWDSQFWGNNSYRTFVELRPGVSTEAVNARIKDITIRNSGGSEDNEVFLHPASKWRLWSKFENGKATGGRIETVRLFGVIAAFILLIACINFMNLSTAGSERRAKEVGIRKVSGARRWFIAGQFLTESAIIALLAGIIALGLVRLSIPAFSYMIGAQLSIPIREPLFWALFAGFILITGLLAGSYPAFFISSFKPIKTLKGTFKASHAAVNPRKVLVVLQFTFAIVLICSTVIVVRQIRYAQERDNGYNRNNIVYLPINGDLEKNYTPLRNELLQSGVATSVTKTSMSVTNAGSNSWGLSWKGKDPNAKIVFDQISADAGFIKTMGLRLVSGRDLDLENYPADSTACLLNESAVKVMHFGQPLGQIIHKDDVDWHVIGIFKDFIWGSPYEATRPMLVMGAANGWHNGINLRMSENGRLSDNLKKAENIFKKYNPEFPFTVQFADQEYARKFDDEQRTARLTASFATLAVFISCLGLFGLAAFMATSRKKEIGIRKVLGASVSGITSLLSKDFLKLVLIAIVIAVPLTWYGMNEWLSRFSYRLPVEWWVFAITGFVAILIAFVTVSFQAVRAALANPVKSLRTE